MTTSSYSPTELDNEQVRSAQEQQLEAMEKAQAREIRRRYAQYGISELVEHLAVELAQSDSLPKHSDVELIKIQFGNLEQAALSSGDKAKIEEAEIQGERLKGLIQTFNDRLKEVQRRRQIETEEAKASVLTLHQLLATENVTFDQVYTEFYDRYNRINSLLLEASAAKQIAQELYDLRTQLYDLPSEDSTRKQQDFDAYYEAKSSLIEQLKSLNPELRTHKQDRRTLSDIKHTWRGIGPIAPEHREEFEKAYREECERIQALLELAYEEERQIRLKANIRKEEILREVESSTNSLDWQDQDTVELVSERLKALQSEWHELPRESATKRQSLEEQFRSLLSAFFEQRKKVRHNSNRMQATIQHKEELISKAEACTKGENQQEAKRALEELFEEWKRIPRTRKQIDDALWERFNSIRHSFYTGLRKTQRGQTSQGANASAISLYKAFIERVKALAADSDHISSRDELNALQEEWKQLPAISRGARRDALYYEFKEQLDTLYERLRSHERNERYSKILSGDGNAQALRQELDTLKRKIKQKEAELVTFENNLERMRGLQQSALQNNIKQMQKKLEQELNTLKQQISELNALLSK